MPLIVYVPYPKLRSLRRHTRSVPGRSPLVTTGPSLGLVVRALQRSSTDSTPSPSLAFRLQSRWKKLKCVQVTSQPRCKACETGNTPCRFRDWERCIAERSRIVTDASAASASSPSHGRWSSSSQGMEHPVLSPAAQGDPVDVSGWNSYLDVPTPSGSGHPPHYALSSEVLSPLSSSPRFNPNESFAYPFFGPAPYTVVNDQTQQLEGVQRLLHDFRPPNPPRPPESLHPTLSSWLKNMNKLSDLIDRLRGLASAASAAHRPRLYRQVDTLRATFKRQQERCIEFLRLTDEYAHRYLLDISAEIQQQRSFLDMLEKRLDMAKTLYERAVDLRKSYESGTASVMKHARDTGEDAFSLLREV